MFDSGLVHSRLDRGNDVVCGEFSPVFIFRLFCSSANFQIFPSILQFIPQIPRSFYLSTVFDMSDQETGAVAFPKIFLQLELDDLNSRLFYASGRNGNNASVITSIIKWYIES